MTNVADPPAPPPTAHPNPERLEQSLVGQPAQAHERPSHPCQRAYSDFRSCILRTLTKNRRSRMRITRDIVADIRGRAAAHGRDPKDILIFYNRAAVVGRTRREAEEKYREYHQHASIEGALAHFSSSTGLDFSLYAPDEPIR